MLADQGPQNWVFCAERSLFICYTEIANTVESEYLTIKFIGRSSHSELSTALDISRRCQSLHVSTIRDSFKIPHHLANVDASYKGIEFDAIVYPAAGTDLRRISTPCEKPDISLSCSRRKEVVSHVILGLEALHASKIVHGGASSHCCLRAEQILRNLTPIDLHAGNIVLPAPAPVEIDQYLATNKPRVDDIRRLDGQPTPQCLPERVTEPVEFGFGHTGQSKIIDFGFSFRAVDGASYSRAVFPSGTPLAPELLLHGATTDPFRTESWYLGLTVRSHALDCLCSDLLKLHRSIISSPMACHLWTNQQGGLKRASNTIKIASLN